MITTHEHKLEKKLLENIMVKYKKTSLHNRTKGSSTKVVDLIYLHTNSCWEALAHSEQKAPRIKNYVLIREPYCFQ